jgi:hypothetical protein
VIRLTEIAVTEFRGLKKLTLSLGDESFAICGRNGTGKSGVVDAIDFALTGGISRLKGSGTGGLSTRQHGPHIDSSAKPAEATVKLTFSVPSAGITHATILRSVAKPSQPIIRPDTPEVRAALTAVANHPEFTLSRRDLIRYVLSDASGRARDVQSLLRLERVGELRGLFQRISNTEAKTHAAAQRHLIDAENRLKTALQIADTSLDTLKDAVDQRRLILGLAPTDDVLLDGALILGLNSEGTTVLLPKAKWLADIDAATDALTELCGDDLSTQVEAAALLLEVHLDNPESVRASQLEPLLERALELFDGNECPVCHVEWEPDAFKEIVAEHIDKHRRAAATLVQVIAAMKAVADTVAALASVTLYPASVGTQLDPKVDTDALRRLGRESTATLALLRLNSPGQETLDALQAWPRHRDSVTTVLAELRLATEALPEQSASNVSRDYLVGGQGAVDLWRNAKEDTDSTSSAATRAKHVFDTYVASTDTALEGIYERVQATFGRLYGLINDDDETDFTARLTPEASSLDLNVDFYGRGHFPPGAYHSEGHQDSMGICLYLALLKHILGDNFTFAVLDDVLMSVDAGHRRAVSRMLVTEFPTTQFILTTHDNVWLKNMVGQSLIKPRQFVHFRTWTVDTGPAEWEGVSVWDEVRNDVNTDQVQNGAATLRHYLEYVSRELCHNLRARVEFHNDGEYPLGDLLPQAVSRLNDRYKGAKAAAQSWGKHDEVVAVSLMQEKLKEVAEAAKIDQWHVNSAVHYNAWANFQPEDFSPVVEAYETLLSAFKCPDCQGLVYVSPGSGTENVLRCPCGTINLNLVKKPK